VLLARDDVELIVNITTPAADVEVALAANAAGKHVWGEKPLALDRKSAGIRATVGALRRAFGVGTPEASARPKRWHARSVGAPEALARAVNDEPTTGNWSGDRAPEAQDHLFG
jgi:hypothetical protein